MNLRRTALLGLPFVLLLVPPAYGDDESTGRIRGSYGANPIDLEIRMPTRHEPRTIAVSGTGKISAAPDVAEISVGVISQAKTAREALAANNEAMEKLIGVLKERGVAAKDIQTTNINVSPQYSQPPRPRPGEPMLEHTPKIVGYQVNNAVQITARDIGKLGTLLDAVVEAGANQMHGISFRIGEPEKLLDQARRKAMADAKRKAELLAGEAGVVVGAPISIRETEGAAPAPRLGRMMSLSAAPAAVPVAAGEQELTATVFVEYELRMPK